MLLLPSRRVWSPRRQPAVMGILNVTPDSFSDGGQFLDADAAMARAAAMLAEGADIIDVGAESTRPGSQPVPADEQIRRAVPVISAIRRDFADAVISVDTRNAEVADAAISAGAAMVNDVSALAGDSAMAGAVAKAGAAIVLVHMRGEPATMQDHPTYRDVVAEVRDHLAARAAFAECTGISPRRIILDPGIGFGKLPEHNVALLRHLDVLVARGYPVLVGASRKAFLGNYTSAAALPAERLGASLACVVRARAAGAAFVRVHDVAATCQLLDTLAALEA